MTDKKLTDVTDNNVGKMTDNEIIKALECCARPLPHCYCDECPAGANGGCAMKTENIIDLINRLQAEIEKQKKKVEMRNIVISKQKAEIEKLKKAKYIFSTVDYCSDDLQKALEEIERLKTLNSKLEAENYSFKVKERENPLEMALLIDEQAEQLKTAKAEAYKECIEKAKSEIDRQSHSRSLEASGERFRIHKILDNLLKELAGDSDV